MSIHEITDMLRKEARRLDDEAVAFTQEGIVMREAAHKLEELQRRKEMQNAECRVQNNGAPGKPDGFLGRGGAPEQLDVFAQKTDCGVGCDDEEERRTMRRAE